MIYKLTLNSHINSYEIKLLGANRNIDVKKVDGVIKFNNGWIAPTKNELITHAQNLIDADILKCEEKLSRLRERTISS